MGNYLDICKCGEKMKGTSIRNDFIWDLALRMDEILKTLLQKGL